ncbi:MAG TPA: 5-(carboxyamino)imidazole ribonucleotide synthase [Candidatus Baltobacteraceae bacterium]|nr:5-(carboxyamino)imidazole ribonucleotide synthase [Candidatus Baltobacteraceae bacterium]
MSAPAIRTIGVIGGGQLGRMFALDAKRMGYHVVTLDPQEHSPCGQVADEQIVAAYDDIAAIEELGRRSDVITYEFENIAIGSVEHLERLGHRVTPSSGVLRVTQDRRLEKTFIRECGLPTADFGIIERIDDIPEVAMTVGFPAVLKTVSGGYDGKGQWRANNLQEAKDGFAAAKGVPLIFERLIFFSRELSVIATRDENDVVVTYPVAENTHDRGILAMTVAPARVDKKIAAHAHSMAETIGRKLGIVGTYCVEFFLSLEEKLLVNEIAPRPHNSGHYTMDVTPCSQYEQHIRAICSLPLSPPRMFCSAIMMNILGQGKGDFLGGVPTLLSNPNIVLHVYGKKHAPLRRKMGHFTMLVEGPVSEHAIAEAKAAHRKLGWSPVA